MVALKQRRGVAGLISVIAIVLVFGLAATTFFQLNSHQVSLISSTSRTIDLQGKKSSEQLQFKISDCILLPDNKTRTITVLTNNTWSESSLLDSVLFIKPDGNVTNSVYVTHPNKTIPPMTNNASIEIDTMDTQSGSTTISVRNATQAVFVTELGKKFSVSHDFGTACVGG
jgi:hypothetical protein